jgi:hypothetical protein
MKNTYQIEVQAQCPVCPTDTDLYQFTIESESLIEVEKIIDFFDKNAGRNKVFQEKLTQHCAVTLGAKVRSVGVHQSVTVICQAP